MMCRPNPPGALVHTIRNNCTDAKPRARTKTKGPADPVQAKWAKRRQAKALDVKVSSGLFTYVRQRAAIPDAYQSHYQAWARRYAATIFCAHTIHYQAGQAESGQYCGAKWCRVCSRIRAGVNYQRYGRELAELPELHFVTLTTGPRVTGQELGSTIDGMVKAWRKVYRTLKDAGHRLAGYRKMEVTYDATTTTYHPHFHILISGIAPALGLQSLWMKHYGQRVSQAGQHCQVVLDRNRDKAVVELMKYTNKTADNKALMDAEALHTINVATFGRQMFCPFGLSKRAKTDAVPQVQPDKVEWLPKRTILFTWDERAANWVDSTDANLSFVQFIPGILEKIQATAKARHGPP